MAFNPRQHQSTGNPFIVDVKAKEKAQILFG
jgi:hypothetical protein